MRASSLMILLLFGCTAVSASLRDARWDIVEVEGQRVTAPAGAQPHLRFGSEGSRLEGFAGCNVVTGEYAMSGESLRIAGPLAVTRKGCTDPAVNELEKRILGTLPSLARYEVSGDTLVLLDSRGRELLRLQKAP